MHSTRLVKLLKTLSLVEFRRFRKFVQSPFHTTNEDLLPFYEALSKHHPHFNAPRLSRERIFQRAFPQKEFSVARFHKLSYELAELVENYLLYLEINADDFQRRKMLTKVYGKRNQYDFFKKETKALLADLEALPYRDSEYYQAYSELNFDYYFHILTPKHTLKDSAISDLANSIDQKLVLEKFRIASELKSRERILSTQYELLFFDEILKAHEEGFMANNLSAGLYRLLFQLYKPDPPEEVFHELKERFSEGIQELRNVSQSTFVVNLINYAGRQINIGKTTFYKEALDLYKLALDVGLLIEGGKMHEAIFANIVTIGCFEKEFKWTKGFIEKYQIYLDEPIRLDVVSHSLGQFYFSQNNFQKAYDQFFNHNFSQAWQLTSRSKLIMTLYELFLLDEKYFSLLLSQIEAFEKFLNRSKIISTAQKEANANFNFILKKLIIGIYNGEELSALKKMLFQKMNLETRILAKSWLTEKLEDSV